MCLNDSSADCESQTGARMLRRVERIEDVVRDRWRNSVTVVTDADLDITIGTFRSERNFAFARRRARERLDSIAPKIQQNLLDLNAVNVHLGQPRCEFDPQTRAAVACVGLR